MNERLKESRINAGYRSVAAAAEALGIKTSTYRAHENGQNEFNPSTAQTYARKFKTTPAYLLLGLLDGLGNAQAELSYQPNPILADTEGLPIIGKVEAGSFRVVIDSQAVISDDTINEEDYEYIPVLASMRFAHARQYALEIVGDSINRIAQNGHYAICADWWGLGWKIEQAIDRLVVCHMIDGDLVETTIKRLVHEKGQLILRPESTNPIYTDINLEDFAANADNGRRIEIKAVVTAFHVPAI